MEIRGTRLREGDIWLGCKSKILGKARLGTAIHIRTQSDWTALRPRHLVSSAALPYKRTWGLPLHEVVKLRRAVKYHHPRGAVGIVRFRGVDSD